ncbi:uncharacterized protein [Venturia canescens]|uniref:uncharacterized protein isoform X1 n=1 Tax=Venturia canescens TaxID=32260 RepID=UPI001C9D16E4|nr:uncharacterized protein LOC122406013 isoform X1 [Venturia canescens]
MEQSSSKGSADGEEILRNFDEEANVIVQAKMISRKSSDRYLLVYNTYKTWREENKKSLSSSEENNLIIYFRTLKEKLKPPTLWSIWSMLKKTLNINENINIHHFLKLKILIKTNAKGYKPKKACVLRWNHITKFMDEASNHTYLAMKFLQVILIFGVCGCLRCDEITNMKVEDVEDLTDKYLVSINYNKNDYAGQFSIGNLFYDTVKKYISLGPSDKFSDRFFIKYAEGKCFRTAIGKHKIGEVPEKIASYLNLPNPKKYTGHSFRRTSATLLSDSGANMQMVKQLGRWRSDIIAQGYIENSMRNREMIYNGVIQKTATTDIHSMPSTSTQNTAEPENDDSDLHVNWLDFDEDFTVNDVDPTPSTVVKNDFTTARNKPILIPIGNRNEPDGSRKNLFWNKPGIKLTFENQANVQPPTRGRRKNDEDSDNQNQAAVQPITWKRKKTMKIRATKIPTV